jgi:hypothetical protein
MKPLADSWVENDPNSPPSADFHDEVEEYDEVDEQEDVCVCVQWQLYVLKRLHTSNKVLHELAREVRGAERRRGQKFTFRQYQLIFDKWAEASKPFFRPNQDYLTEFLAKLDCITVPKGETLRAAFERAKLRQLPVEVHDHPNPDFQLFATLCRELHELGGGAPIMIHQVTFAKLFGHSHHHNISNWIRAAKTLGVLASAAPARWSPSAKKGKSARYWYVAEDAGPQPSCRWSTN